MRRQKLDLVVCTAPFDLENKFGYWTRRLGIGAARHRKKAEGARGQTKRARVRARSILTLTLRVVAAIRRAHRRKVLAVVSRFVQAVLAA